MISAIILAPLIIALLYAAICHALFGIAVALNKILDAMCEVFKVFVGITPVVANGESTYLLNAFFSNGAVSAVYRGMAIIGIAMTFAFALAAVIKKGFDSSGEKVKATYGMIIGNVLKAILLIILMTAIVSATISATGVLMRQINLVFSKAQQSQDASEIYFTDSDYATMFRVLDTIANSSLNPGYNNRFNINSCFNSIRFDLQLLDNNKVFNFSYDIGAEAQNSWQAALLEIFSSCDVYEELPIDIYNESLTSAMLNCMDKLQHDGSFKPLSYYYRGYKSGEGDDFQLGKMVMVISSFDAAWNSKYNKNPSLYDSLRSPFMTGSKSIYNLIDVELNFCLSFGFWNHFIAIFVSLFLIWEFLIMLINAVARIFNIIILYITAPFFASVMPLDDGGKMKQWTTAFVIQSLSIFGSVVAIRLLMIFIPIIVGGDIVLSDSAFVSTIAKLALMIGMCVTAEKASGMITGILADNAGYQSIMAGDVGGGVANKAASLAGSALKLGAKAAGAGLKAGADATGLTTAVNEKKEGISNKFQAMRERGGYKAAKKANWETKGQQKEREEGDKAAKKEKEQKQFQSDVLSKLDNLGGRGGQSGNDNQSGGPVSSDPPAGPGGDGVAQDGQKHEDSTRSKNDNNNKNNNNKNDDEDKDKKNGKKKPQQEPNQFQMGPSSKKDDDEPYAYMSPKSKDDSHVNIQSRPTLTPPPASNPVTRPRSGAVYNKGGNAGGQGSGTGYSRPASYVKSGNSNKK